MLELVLPEALAFLLLEPLLPSPFMSILTVLTTPLPLPEPLLLP
jgi:hypothetical protein